VPELGPLTKIAIADARGVCFEYAPRRIIRERNNWSVAYFPHHKYGTGAGRYSDDAQMTCAVAETLVECGPDASARDFAERFVRSFKREVTPREGYASAFFDFLKSVKDADDFLARIRPDSEKSGGAMRAGPCGVLGSVEQVKVVAARQAAITHNTPGGIAAAQAAALMCHYFYYRIGPRTGLPAFLDAHVPGHDWAQPHKGDIGPVGIDAVRAALTAVMAADTLPDLLIACVDFGGDVDTVAAIAMAAAAWSVEIDQALPQMLWDELESGEYGRDYLAGLDRRFAAFAASQGAK
jgi:ADP-ribosyl-[dinitrogen reductase] hydrolase